MPPLTPGYRITKACSVGLALAIALSLSAGAAFGQIEGLTWSAPETIGVGTLSDGRSPSAVHTPLWASSVWEDEWHLVYVYNDLVLYRTRDEAGVWSVPTTLVSSTAVAHPRLAFAEDRLIAVWEDGRDGTTDIYARSRWISGWSSEQCLSCGSGPAITPALAGNELDGLVLWEDTTGSIEARHYDDGSWGSVETVAVGSVASPSVAVINDYVHWDESYYEAVYTTPAGIAWASRDPDGTWVDRGTWVSGPCSSPSLAMDFCCGDVVGNRPFVAFERIEGGVPEVWIARLGAEMRLTPAFDGIPSTGPQAHAWAFIWGDCFWGNLPYERIFVTWMDGGPSGETWIAEVDRSDLEDERESGGAGEVRSLLATAEGEPYAGLLHLTQSGGEVVARIGSIPGCSRQSFDKPAALIVGPAGQPTNRIQQINECGGEPLIVYWGSKIRFGPEADAGILWDVAQEHPSILLDFDPPDALLEVGIRAGGCVENAPVELGSSCLSWPNHEWPGVRSPDVNGDCYVSQNDLDYVTNRLGSDDFCADLDGSGVVDELDVAIVEATLGDQCTPDASSVDNSDDSHRLALRVSPNPGSGPFRLELGLPTAGPVDLRIYDTQGRQVRALGFEPAGARSSERMWDGRDSKSQPVAAGVYYVRARLEETTIERTVLVIR